MNAFFKELREGRVYRTAVSYAVASWLILQLAAIVGPALGLPSWTLAATIGVLLCGFTAALWIGWVQHHRARPVAAVPQRRRHFLAFAVLSVLPALVVVAGFATFHRVSPASRDAAPGEVPEKSIAVLPFDNLSDEKSNAYFAEGIQDEILTDLAKVADLKVISRTSVMAYVPGHVAGSVRQIGLALGVAYLLEGSVQRAAGRVRVTAQLIDTRTDAHKWAEHFDRDLSDVFAIQTEMAERIVASLRAKLSPVERTAMDTWPTSDLAAYDLFLRAKGLVNTFQETPDWPGTLNQALRLLDEATAHDGNFALAYCLAARAHDQFYYLGLDSSQTRLALEENASATALRLQPNLGEAHLARAFYFFHGLHDFAATHRELAVARAALPNNAEVFSLETYLARREGRWAEALSTQERAVALDPRNPIVLEDQIITYDMLRFYRDEVRACDAAMGVAPASVTYLRVLKAAALLSAGQPAASRAELDRVPAEYDPNGTTTGVRVSVALAQRQWAEAVARLAAFGGKVYPGINGVLTPREWLGAIVARATGDTDKARSAFEEARKVAEADLRQRPDAPDALALMGQIDAALGNKDAALREGKRAVELRPVSADAMDGPGVAGALAMIYAWTGETDAALRQLEGLEKTPGGPDYGQLRFDPTWDPLKGQARFEAMLARMDPHLGP